MHFSDREYNTQYMLIADTFTVHRETGKQNSKPAPVPQYAQNAQNASSSDRSPAFSRSTRTRELGPEPGPIFHFAAAHTYQNLG